MGFSAKEQIIDQIKKSETILLCTAKNPHGDALGAALGFYLSLKKFGKKTDLISPTPVLEKFSYLPSSELITHKLEGSRDYVFSVDIKKDKLQQLRYEVEDNKLRIFITAKNGDLKEKNINLESSRFKYDLIIILGTPDLENLGNLYDENPELFYEAPIINIDNSPENEYFGKINFVDVAVSSTSEIVYEIISSIDEKLIDDKVATNLLTGIITKTNSFQNKNTTPKAFLAAASLITKGANKEEIIRYLYKTKSISTLKLMGIIMSNLKYNSQYKLGWSIIPNENFSQLYNSPESLHSVVSELANSSPEFDLMFLLFEENKKIHGILNFSEKMNDNNFENIFNGEMNENQIIFTSDQESLEFAEKDILKKIKGWKDSLS